MQYVCVEHGPAETTWTRRLYTSPPSVIVQASCGDFRKHVGLSGDLTICIKHGTQQAVYTEETCEACGDHRRTLLTCGCEGHVLVMEGLNIFVHPSEMNE